MIPLNPGPQPFQYLQTPQPQMPQMPPAGAGFNPYNSLGYSNYQPSSLEAAISDYSARLSLLMTQATGRAVCLSNLTFKNAEADMQTGSPCEIPVYLDSSVTGISNTANNPNGFMRYLSGYISPSQSQNQIGQGAPAVTFTPYTGNPLTGGVPSFRNNYRSCEYTSLGESGGSLFYGKQELSLNQAAGPSYMQRIQQLDAETLGQINNLENAMRQHDAPTMVSFYDDLTQQLEGRRSTSERAFRDVFHGHVMPDGTVQIPQYGGWDSHLVDEVTHTMSLVRVMESKLNYLKFAIHSQINNPCMNPPELQFLHDMLQTAFNQFQWFIKNKAQPALFYMDQKSRELTGFANIPPTLAQLYDHYSVTCNQFLSDANYLLEAYKSRAISGQLPGLQPQPVQQNALTPGAGAATAAYSALNNFANNVPNVNPTPLRSPAYSSQASAPVHSTPVNVPVFSNIANPQVQAGPSKTQVVNYPNQQPQFALLHPSLPVNLTGQASSAPLPFMPMPRINQMQTVNAVPLYSNGGVSSVLANADNQRALNQK